MSNDEVLQRIAAWEAAGLIDADTARRLRAAEVTVETPPAERASGARAAALSSFFGPTPTIAELFGYVGAGFVLAAWHTLSLTSRGGSTVAEWLVPAAAFAAIGLVLARRSDRERRAAGVALGVATGHVFGAGMQLLDVSAAADWAYAVTASAAAAAAAALLFRRLHPAVLTQVGLLGAIGIFAAASLQWLGEMLFPATAISDYVWPRPPDPNATIKVILDGTWWIAWALVFGVIGLWEAGARGRTGYPESVDAGSVAAGRRAGISRFAAGLAAVLGVTSAVMASGYDAAGYYGRVVVPWLGDGLILVVALALLGIAVRRGATAYLYPAALGVIVAFSDLNGTYVVERTGVGVALLLEGLILIGGGVLAERVRRRMAAEPARTVPA